MRQPGRVPARKGMTMSDNRRSHNGFVGKGAYIALAMCLVAVGMIAFITMLTPRQDRAQDADAPVVQADPSPVVPTTKPEVVELTPSPVETAPVTAPEEIPAPEDLVPTVVSPLDGTTVTVFSVTELMYDATMADWRTHNGMDIQAGEGDAVKTAADGVVTSVTTDELMGVTVMIQHAGGYTTQYSSLQADPPVTLDQQVRAGEIIGYVGSTASAESNMGPHLHFSVSKDGTVIDPREYVG